MDPFQKTGWGISKGQVALGREERVGERERGGAPSRNGVEVAWGGGGCRQEQDLPPAG